VSADDALYSVEVIDRDFPAGDCSFSSMRSARCCGMVHLVNFGGNVMNKPITLVPQATDEQPKIEGGLREILRRADRELHQEGGAPSTRPSHPMELVRRVAGMSTEQIERIVLQLQSLSELVQSERDRVNSEIAGYVKLNDHALSAMQAITDALTKLNDAIPKRQA
jgi:hypothetical protein